VSASPAALLEQLASIKAPAVEKWLDRATT
jgi:hypothetical protein